MLCEKPLAPEFGAATSIAAELADRADLISLGFMRRFDPGYVDLKEAIGAGTYGRTLLVHSTGRGVSSGPGSTSESSVTNSAIHDLDVVPWLLDAPIAEASWQSTVSSSRVTGLADPQVILLRTAAGVLAVVEIFLNAGYGYDIRCEVVCESAALQLTEPATITVDATCGTRLATPRIGGPASRTPTGGSCRPGSTRCPAPTGVRWPPCTTVGRPARSRRR